jgi:hypothetical protein
MGGELERPRSSAEPVPSKKYSLSVWTLLIQ